MQMASIMSEPAVLFSVELLLDTIKQHPMLYDKTNPRYKEAEYKKEIWKQIAQDLGVTEAMCQNKFKNLKDNFTKIKTKLKDKSRSGAGAKDVPTVKWRHFEAMIPIMEKVHEEPIICTNITFVQTGGSEMSAEGLSDDAQLEPPATDHIEVEWSKLDAGTSSSTTTSVHPAASSDTSETSRQTGPQEKDVVTPNRSESRPQKIRRAPKNDKTPSDDDAGAMAVAAECLNHLKVTRDQREQQKDVLYHFAHTMIGMLCTRPTDDQFNVMHAVQNLVHEKIKEVRQRGNVNV